MRLWHYLSKREDEGASAQTQGKPTDNKTDNNERAWIRTIICHRIQPAEMAKKKGDEEAERKKLRKKRPQTVSQ